MFQGNTQEIEFPMPSDSPNPLVESEGPKGLSLYRRKRPYSIEQDLGLNRWDVMDLQTGEQLGQVIPFKDDDRYYVICHASQVGKQFEEPNGVYSTRWQAADAIWQKALPLRSRIWLLLKCGVHAMDWATRVFAILVAFYSIWILCQAAVMPEHSRIAKLSTSFANGLIRWFDSWGQGNVG